VIANVQPLPVLYSFRRCPYAMRARMALHHAGIVLEHREILLKNKPPSMLVASKKGTVPVLVLGDGEVIDESWEVVQWALSQNDPDNWLGTDHCFLDQARSLVEECDGEFKQALDHYKYADRYPQDAEVYREQAMPFLLKLDHMLTKNRYLLADHCSIADIAIMPFVRQFAFVDIEWFSNNELAHLQRWLTTLFTKIMEKRPLWAFESV